MTTIISGKLCEHHGPSLDLVHRTAYEAFKDVRSSRHAWIVYADADVRKIVEELKTCRCIMDAIRARFDNHDIHPVETTDEIMWAASPREAKGSDRSLVDCHKDGPFSMIRPSTAVWYRVILAVNDNDAVTTHFPAAGISVRMKSGEFHGLHYDRDEHCVEGSIAEGSHRVLLKMHYLIVPKNSSLADEALTGLYVRCERAWANVSRSTMNASIDPKTPFQKAVAASVNVTRKYPNFVASVVVASIVMSIIFMFLRK